MIPLDAAQADERYVVAIRLRHVKQSEWNVVRISSQCLHAALASRLPTAGIGRSRRQLAQQDKLALADHTLRIIGIGADDPAGIAIVVRDRAVGEGVVGLLRVA